MTDVPRTRWARTVDGASIAYQDLGERSGHARRHPRLGLAPRDLLGAAALRMRFIRRSVPQPPCARLRQARHRHVGPRAADPPTSASCSTTCAPSWTPPVWREPPCSAGARRARLRPRSSRPRIPSAPCVSRTTDGSTCARRSTARGGNPRASSRTTSPPSSSRGAATRVRASSSESATAARSIPLRTTIPAFVAWNAKLARFAATPVSYEAFERMWSATDIRPLLASISTPTTILYSSLDQESEESARFEAGLIPVARLVGFSGPDAIIWVHEPQPIVSAIEQFIQSVRHEEAERERMLATVLFTDIVGSTDKARAVGDACWTELLDKHDATVRAPSSPATAGTEVNSDRRRLPRSLRRACARGEVRPRHLRGSETALPRSEGRLPHRRDRAGGRRCGRHRRARRRPRRRPRQAAQRSS